MDLREEKLNTGGARHPWEQARARFFLSLLRRSRLTDEPISIADIGAGDGYFARALAQDMPDSTNTVCCDLNYTDEWMAARARDPAWQGLQFVREIPDQRFDLLILLDVLEHVPDDVAFVRQLVSEHLRPGGRVLASVPAWMSLFSRHDIGVAHYRRYRPSQLLDTLRAGGLQVVHHGNLFHSLLGPRMAQKAWELVRGVRSRPCPEAPPENAQRDIATWSKGPALTGVIQRVLRADNFVSALCARMRIPLPGLSTWALCHLPGQQHAHPV